MKQLNVYKFSEIKAILLKHLAPEYELYISDALYEWCHWERFIHVNLDKAELIISEYKEEGYSYKLGKIIDKVQKWIEIIQELIIIIESKELPEDFIVDYKSDLSVYM